MIMRRIMTKCEDLFEKYFWRIISNEIMKKIMFHVWRTLFGWRWTSCSNPLKIFAINDIVNFVFKKTVDTLVRRWTSSSNQRWIARHYLFTRLSHLDLMTWWIVSTNDSLTNRWSSHWSHHLTSLSDDISWLCDDSSI
jgi:hypothetical protein